MTDPQAPKHTALLPVRETFEAAFYESALLDGMAELYPMGIKALRVGDAYDVRYGRLNTLWEGWQLRSSIEPDPSSSAQEVRAALDGRETALKAAYDFAFPTLSERHKEKGAVGVFCDAFRLGFDAGTRKALAFAPPVRTNAEGEK